MSFAICRMKKFKMRDVKGIQIHNQREKESHTNPDIEKKQSHLNYDLHNDQYIDYLRIVKEKGGLIRSKTVEIGLEDFQRIKTLAKASEVFKRENEMLQRQNHALKVNHTDLHTIVKHLEKER